MLNLAQDGHDEVLFQKGILAPAATAKVLKSKTLHKQLTKWIEQGLVIIEEVSKGKSVKEKKEICYVLCEKYLIENPSQKEKNPGREAIKSFRDLLNSKQENNFSYTESKTLYLLNYLSTSFKDGVVPYGELRKMYSGAGKVLSNLLEKNTVNCMEKRIFRNPFGEPLCHFARPEQLTDEQENCVRSIASFLGRKEGKLEKTFQTFLIHGVTGCGKTEIYLRAAERCLELGRDVLVLVPEIALASQLEAHFVSRFNDQVVLLHSGMSAGVRFDQWSLAATGKARIVIGARSAVFAPLADPGLIIVDEEHDSGFKQDDSLCYQGRDLAVLRGKYNKAVVLLGSATPSVTSYFNCQQGKYKLLELKKRVRDRSLPRVELVDLRNKAEKNANKSLGKKLTSQLVANLEQGNQSLLLLNRRGFSSIMLCRECGEVVRCRQCNVSLTYHKNKDKLICHYCGYSLGVQLLCSKCHSTELIPVGYGTERVEQELRDLLPEARIGRLDTDTAVDRKKFHSILRKMHRGEIDILLGTQMIAKGHDFPGVTLVGVIWADGGINMPDFRASEKTFQLLSQVTGRAGRGEKPGHVIIQTLRPDHYAISLSSQHDYKQLFEKEIESRGQVGFPPHVRMINLRISGPEKDHVQQSCNRLAAYIRQWIKDVGQDNSASCPTLLGPVPSPLDKLRGRYRWQALLKGGDHKYLHRLCSQIVEKKTEFLKGKTRITVDVDPENMM